MSSETQIPEDKIRSIAREEAEEVYDVEVEDADGEGWSIGKLMDRFQVSRRTALKAIGLIAVGYGAPRAVLQVISQNAEAAAQDDLNVPGTLTAGSVDTDEADITNETYIKAVRNSNSNSKSSGSWAQIADTEVDDNLNEMDSSLAINPDESGRYTILANARIYDGTDQDSIFVALRDVDANSTVGEEARTELSGGSGGIGLAESFELSAGTNYGVRVQNPSSSFRVSAFGNHFTVIRGVVQP